MKKALTISIFFFALSAFSDINLEPSANSYYYYLEAQCKAKQGNLDEAIAIMKTVISQDPESETLKQDIVEMYHARSYAFYQDENFDQALKDLEKAYQIKPSDPYTFKSLSNLYLKKGDLDSTYKLLDDSINKIPIASEKAVLISEALISRYHEYRKAYKFLKLAISSIYFQQSDTTFDSTKNLVLGVLHYYPKSPMYLELLSSLEKKSEN